MPSPILAATDFSAVAGFAVERAALLARARRCPLHLLHVYNEFAWSSLRRLLREPPGHDVEAPARERLAATARTLADRHGLTEVSGQILTGRASAAIAARAGELGAGLVVLGAHGAGVDRALALGGTAIKVLRASPGPVLVVRREPLRDYERVLVATDFSATATRALRAALDGFPTASHCLVHVHALGHAAGGELAAGVAPADIERHRAQEREAAQRNLQAYVAYADYLAAGNVRTLAREGYPASVLLEEASAQSADLLVVGKHGAGALEERLLGSVTLNLLHHAPCDVLLVP
jgi:nucleotide-binding universal stress UspA family protein